MLLGFRASEEDTLPDTTINRFRKRRGRWLRRQIDALARHFGREISVLDVGGRPDYWLNVGFGGIGRIELVDYDRKDLDRPLPAGAPQDLFVRTVGDARDLRAYGDGAVDLVHSNSVIEHVGGWSDMPPWRPS